MTFSQQERSRRAGSLPNHEMEPASHLSTGNPCQKHHCQRPECLQLQVGHCQRRFIATARSPEFYISL